MRISDWSSDVCSSDLLPAAVPDNATDFFGLNVGAVVSVIGKFSCCGRRGLLLLRREQCVELVFKCVIADAVIQLGAGMHHVDDILLMSIAANRRIDRFGRLVG